MIILGRNEKEHDERLIKVLEIARESIVKFNLNICQFKKPNLKYMGHIISSKGVGPDENKIEAIKNANTNM